MTAAGGAELMKFDSAVAGLYVGGTGNEGDVIVRDAANVERIKLDAGEGDIFVKTAEATICSALTARTQRSTSAARATKATSFCETRTTRSGSPRRRRRRRSCAQRERRPVAALRQRIAALYVGGTGNEGDVIVRDEKNNERIKLDGGEGDILVRSKGEALLHFDSGFAALYVGGTGNEGDVIVRDQNNNERISRRWRRRHHRPQHQG